MPRLSQFLVLSSGKFSARRLHLNRNLQVREGAMWASKGRLFQAKEVANIIFPRWDGPG